MSSLIHCIYCSRSARDFSDSGVTELLAAARRNNTRDNITGMLLYVDRSFFQVLEGSAEAVNCAFSRIAADPRHYRVTEIIREPIAQRSFSEWTMGFAKASRVELGGLTGENDFLTNPHCLETIGPGRAKKLLTVFKNGGWRPDETGVFPTSAGKTG